MPFNTDDLYSPKRAVAIINQGAAALFSAEEDLEHSQS